MVIIYAAVRSIQVQNNYGHLIIIITMCHIDAIFSCYLFMSSHHVQSQTISYLHNIFMNLHIQVRYLLSTGMLPEQIEGF